MNAMDPCRILRDLQSQLRGLANSANDQLGEVYINPSSAPRIPRAIAEVMRANADGADHWANKIESSVKGDG